MTALFADPHWSEDDRWAKFLLLVVPMTGLAMPETELYQRVQAQVSSDAVLFDLVSVQPCQATDGTPEQDELIVTALLRGVFAEGHFFAPRAVFGCVLTGPDAEMLDRLRERLAEHVLLRDLTPRFFNAAVGEGDGADAAAAVTGFVKRMIRDYEREPGTATSERRFLKVLETLTARRAAIEEPRVSRLVAHLAAPDPAPTMWRRLRERVRRTPTVEPPAMPVLAGETDAISLAYLVFLPDDYAPSRVLANRRKAVAVELDAKLNQVVRDPESGRAMGVAIEVICAGARIDRRHGVVAAGSLNAKDLPPVPVGDLDFDFDAMIEALLQEHQRLSRSHWGRGVDVLGAHFVFFATTSPMATRESVERFEELLAYARVTWLHFGPGSEMIPVEFERDGAQLLPDQPDIADVVMHYCKDIYATRWSQA